MLTQDMKTALRSMLIEHEGYEKFPYVDTVGKITIGVGYNLSDRGLPDSFINEQLKQDIEFFYNSLYNTYSWFKWLNPARQCALVDMSFMGLKKFAGFTKMIKALQEENYEDAAKEMLNSQWAQQVGRRAAQLAIIIETGKLKDGVT